MRPRRHGSQTPWSPVLWAARTSPRRRRSCSQVWSTGPPDPPSTDTTKFGARKPQERVTRLYTVAGSVRSDSRRNCGHRRKRHMGERDRDSRRQTQTNADSGLERGQRPRERQTDELGGYKDLEREREGQTLKTEAHKDRVDQWVDIFSVAPAPPSLVSRTCRPHVAGLSSRVREVQVPVGICGLLRGVLITVPLGNYSCPKGILHSHRRVGIPRLPTLAQGPSGGMRVEYEPWVSPLNPSCTNVHILSTWDSASLETESTINPALALTVWRRK